MDRFVKKIGKEIMSEIALSFFFVALVIVLIHICFSAQIDLAVSLVNKFSIVENKKTENITLDLVKKRLVHYPNYKEKYATLKIPSINLYLPVYHGDTMDILRYGVGHYAGSYFPGEGGSVIFAAHNNEGFFRNLPLLNIEDTIEVETVYGTFAYQVFETKIVLESDLSSFPVQDEEEMLILYTCYPVTAIGHTDKRYVVYAKKVGEKYDN